MPNHIKKTLLVTLDFPPNIGGVANYYYHVCKNLPPDKIVVLAPNYPGAAAFDQAEHFPIIRQDLLKKIPDRWPTGLAGVIKLAATVRWLTLIRHIRRISKLHHIELIAAGQVLPIGTVALMNLRRSGVPYIFFAHGLDILLPQNFMRKKTLLKRIVSSSSGIIANSHFTADELIKLGASPKKIVVAYPCPGLETESVSTQTIEQVKTHYHLHHKKVLLTIGRLVERKGHDMVIAALPDIIKKVSDVCYVIVGDGPMRQQLQQQVNRAELGNHVIFTGALSNTETAALLHACDVFIMPNRRLPNGDVEGFGTVFLEANQCGKPVIGGNNGGVPEAIINHQTGLLVDPNDQHEISDAAILLLTDSAYAERLGLQGLERVANHFDWKVQTEKIKSLLV